MPNIGFAQAQPFVEKHSWTAKTVTLLLLLLLIVLTASGCGYSEDNRKSGALETAEPAADDYDPSLDAKPKSDDSQSDSAIVTTDEPLTCDAPDYPGRIGYVVKKEDSRILVVSPESRKLGPDMNNMDYYDAIWFGSAPEHIQVGMKVEAWAKGGTVEDSYPGQAGAGRVDVLNGAPPQEAELSEAEAIREAIGQLEPDEHSFPIVLDSEYRPSENSWMIELLNEDRQRIQIEIEDHSHTEKEASFDE